ncbi:MAG: hypothetical protein OEX04_16290 [Acidimicrobiia bacterium]|nr:hypothetical protein [Acidimicrobiia bacterium]MDH4309027.1 hypothetical protein [Acidimicrobiia bacterium]MDH5293561.1 hypothetical protein [Acidimicrobiia bacterium]
MHPITNEYLATTIIADRQRRIATRSDRARRLSLDRLLARLSRRSADKTVVEPVIA